MASTFVRAPDGPARSRLVRAALLAATALALSTLALAVNVGPARAQMGGMGPLGGAPGAGGGGGGSETKDTKPPPAPALPGARSLEDTVAPAERPASEMSPTDALFDAIDRGDLAGAREAISRGADLNGRNLLGQSPLDVAIDLGRNPITFLLLSLRNSESEPQPGARVAAASAPAALAHGRRVAKAPVAAAVSVPSVPVANGGAPVPAFGFLGFSPTPAAFVPGRSGVDAPVAAAVPAPLAASGGGSEPADGFLGFAPAPAAAPGLR